MVPNKNGLWETSVPLLPLGGLNEKPVVASGGEAPNVNGAFFSGGVAGAAPKEKGLADEDLTSAVGTVLGFPKENPLDAPAPKRGLGT